MTRPVAVVGAGAWGTALAHVLASVGRRVNLWCYEEEVARSIRESRVNTLYLPGAKVHQSVETYTDLRAALAGARVVVSVSPAQVVRRVMTEVSGALAPDAIIVSASKGIEASTALLMHEVLSQALPGHSGRIAALSGPSFALEVAREMPTAVSVAAPDQALAAEVQEAFACRFFRVYTQDDLLGVELGGALKNVIALGAGISDGLGFGHNSRAALITRGIAEIGRLGAKMGANPMTFLGLSGLGDLVLTCTGELSRNRTVGMRLGQGESLPSIVASMRAVAEGVETSRAVNTLMERHGVEMPISRKVWEILHEGLDPKAAVAELMARPSRREFWDIEEQSR